MLKLLAIAVATTLVTACKDFNGADECMQGLLLLGDPDFKFPTNNHELDKHCGAIAGKEKCVRDHSDKCFDAFSRQVSSNLITSAVKINRLYCNQAKNRQVFMKLGQCSNPRKTLLDQTMKAFIGTSQAISSFDQKKLKIPLLCCNFKQFKGALLDITENDIQPKCSEKDTEEMEKLIDGFSNDVLNLLCPQDYSPDSGEKCDTILGMTPKVTTDSRYKSLLLPLVKIFDSLKG